MGVGRRRCCSGVACCFGSFLANIGASNSLSTELDARFTLERSENSVHFERIFPLRLTAQGDTFGFQNWHVARKRDGSKGNSGNLESVTSPENPYLSRHVCVCRLPSQSRLADYEYSRRACSTDQTLKA